MVTSALPILTAPTAPAQGEVIALAAQAQFMGRFRRDLTDSDALHWGEGTVAVSRSAVSVQGRIAPRPDYKLYLSPEFVQTEADFLRLKAKMLRVGDVKTFENFVVSMPASADPTAYNTVIVWCDSFPSSLRRPSTDDVGVAARKRPGAQRCARDAGLHVVRRSKLSDRG